MKVCFEIVQLVIKHVTKARGKGTHTHTHTHPQPFHDLSPTRHYIKVIYRRVSSALQLLLLCYLK